jgi:hypothetical protein
MIKMSLHTLISNDEKMCMNKQRIKESLNMLTSPESIDFLVMAVDFRMSVEQDEKEDKMKSGIINLVK